MDSLDRTLTGVFAFPSSQSRRLGRHWDFSPAMLWSVQIQLAELAPRPDCAATRLACCAHPGCAGIALRGRWLRSAELRMTGPGPVGAEYGACIKWVSINSFASLNMLDALGNFLRLSGKDEWNKRIVRAIIECPPFHRFRVKLEKILRKLHESKIHLLLMPATPRCLSRAFISSGANHAAHPSHPFRSHCRSDVGDLGPCGNGAGAGPASLD